MGNEPSPSMRIDESAMDDNDNVASTTDIKEAAVAVDEMTLTATATVTVAADAEIKPLDGEKDATTIIESDVPSDVVVVPPPLHRIKGTSS